MSFNFLAFHFHAGSAARRRRKQQRWERQQRRSRDDMGPGYIFGTLTKWILAARVQQSAAMQPHTATLRLDMTEFNETLNTYDYKITYSVEINETVVDEVIEKLNSSG